MRLATLAEAATWLDDHLDELPAVPLRLHGRAGDASGRHTSQGSPVFHTSSTTHDGLGSPPFSPGFWAVLTQSPYATIDVTETRSCPRAHGWGEECLMCSGNLEYKVTRTVYRHALAAALERLRKAPATSPLWPTPYQLCIAFMRAGCDLSRAAWSVGRAWRSEDERGTVEAAFLLALRKLQGRWASGPLPRARSEAQSIAEFGKEAA